MEQRPPSRQEQASAMIQRPPSQQGMPIAQQQQPSQRPLSRQGAQMMPPAAAQRPPSRQEGVSGPQVAAMAQRPVSRQGQEGPAPQRPPSGGATSQAVSPTPVGGILGPMGRGRGLASRLAATNLTSQARPSPTAESQVSFRSEDFETSSRVAAPTARGPTPTGPSPAAAMMRVDPTKVC